jgi:two-component system response regulator FixJ
MLNNPEQLTSLGHVIVIDDDASVRRSLRSMLERVGYEVHVHEGAEAFLQSPTVSSPSVILLDMRMPGMTGVGLQTQLQNSLQQVPIIFMSGDSRPDEIITAMKQGAFDFLLKPFTAQALMEVVQRAMLHAESTRKDADLKAHLAEQIKRLTPRELEICKWMVRGFSNKQIASFDGAAPATIKLHRAHVMEKLGVRTLPELIEALGHQFESA